MSCIGSWRHASYAAARVEFIKRAQALGFSLDEVALLLGLSDGEHCAETKVLAARKLAMVEGKIAHLAAIQKALKTLVSACAKGGRGRGCPIIDALGMSRRWTPMDAANIKTRDRVI